MLADMWWYRDRDDDDTSTRPAGEQVESRLTEALSPLLAGSDDPRLPLLAVGVLVDHDVSWEDGQEASETTPSVAERIVQQAVAGDEPPRLYNRFTRELGERFTLGDDLDDADRRTVQTILSALRGAEGVASVTPHAT